MRSSTVGRLAPLCADRAFEGASVEIYLKHQGLRFDFALSSEDETKLLVVTRGVTARLPRLDDYAELPPFVCALRIETVLRSLEPIEAGYSTHRGQRH